MIYDAYKKKLALQFPGDRRSYTEDKQEFIECLLKEAYVSGGRFGDGEGAGTAGSKEPGNPAVCHDTGIGRGYLCSSFIFIPLIPIYSNSLSTCQIISCSDISYGIGSISSKQQFEALE